MFKFKSVAYFELHEKVEPANPTNLYPAVKFVYFNIVPISQNKFVPKWPNAVFFNNAITYQNILIVLTKIKPNAAR